MFRGGAHHLSLSTVNLILWLSIRLSLIAIVHVHGLLGGRTYRCPAPHGSIYVWEKEATNIKSWDGGKSWTFRQFRGPADLYYTTDGSGLIKEAWTIRACQIDFHIACYYTHFKDDRLIRPSQCEQLRNMTPRP